MANTRGGSLVAYTELTNTLTGEVIRIHNPFASCPICGDDVEVHDWITTSDCDRNED
ncbi:MAG: hypothetical protein ABIQ39_02060 [Ilumatobacteraceae bacterium]